MSRKVAVMFLGGSLDHAIRKVDPEPYNPRIPKDDTYTVTREKRAPSIVDHILPPDPPEETYILRQIAIGGRVWWVYVLRNYSPPRSHILDSCPYPQGAV